MEPIIYMFNHMEEEVDHYTRCVKNIIAGSSKFPNDRVMLDTVFEAYAQEEQERWKRAWLYYFVSYALGPIPHGLLENEEVIRLVRSGVQGWPLKNMEPTDEHICIYTDLLEALAAHIDRIFLPEKPHLASAARYILAMTYAFDYNYLANWCMMCTAPRTHKALEESINLTHPDCMRVCNVVKQESERFFTMIDVYRQLRK